MLLGIRFSGGIGRIPAGAQHVALIALTKKIQTAPRKMRIPQPLQFHPLPPARARLELPAVPLLPAPELEVAKAALPEIPRVEAPPPAIMAAGFSELQSAGLPAPRRPVVRASGFQMAETSAAGPTRGAAPTAVGSFESYKSAQSEGAVRSTNAVSRAGGFSDVSASVAGGSRGGSITSGTFGDATVDKSAPVVRGVVAATFTPIEILSKPKPAYSAEARAKKIEGEVLLAMQFSASGAARVERVMRGLGYGLDESAVAAAEGIRFRPAMRNGGAVDSAAIVHIVFQLAQ